MRIKHLLIMAAAAMFAIAACEDPEPINGNDPANNGKDTTATNNGRDPFRPGRDTTKVTTNYWYGQNTALRGIKSIVQEDDTEEYDSHGRLISTSSSNGETSYTYNLFGLLTKVTTTEMNWDSTTITYSETLEYGNTGKFCPVPMGPGSVFHIYWQGLAPGLSKITFENHPYNGDVVMEYKFQGDTLLVITTTGGTMLDSLGNEVPAEWDDIEIEYAGAYPYRLANEHEFIGPITYQENGMFDTYIEGFFSWDPNYPGFVTQKTTRTVSKSRQDIMLVEKEVIEMYNDGEPAPWNIQTRTYTYNEHGDEISEAETNDGTYGEDYLTTYEYEYDAKGNWTKVTTTFVRTRPEDTDNSTLRTYTQERTITYY